MVTLRNTPSRTHSHAQRCPVDHPVERLESNSGEISDVVLNDMAQFAFRTFQRTVSDFLSAPTPIPNVVTIDELRSRQKDPLKLVQRRQRGFRKGPAVIDIKDPYSSAIHIAFLDELDESDS